MKKHLTSKLAIIIYSLALIGLLFWAYTLFKAKKVNAPSSQSFTQDSSNDIASVDDIANDSDGDNQNANASDNQSSATSNTENSSNTQSVPAQVIDKNAPSVSPETNVSGSMLAKISTEHCNNGCQAFSNDLILLEYCQQACGISPIKNVTNCDDKKDIQKDYCNKDLAINKKDLSLCEKIADANIKQSCQNRINQDIIENL
jgi:hypothetical protein